MIYKKKNSGISPFFVLLLTIFVDMTGFGIVIPLLPFYLDVFQVGEAALGILIATFALMQLIASPIIGRLSDKVGRRPIILLSILTSALSFFIFAIADSFIVLLLSRIVAGIATEVGVAQAYISDITTEKERVAAMGKVGAALGAGFIIGPALGGFLSNYGFSGAGYFATILALVNFTLVFFFLPESKTFNKNLSEKVVKLGFFKGLINSISIPTIKLVFTLLFISSLAFAAFPILMPLLARSFFNITEPEMAVFFMYTGLLTIIFQGFIIGKIGKRINETKMITIGSALMAIGFCIFPFSPSYIFLVLIAAIPGFGSGLLGTALNSYLSKIIPSTELGGTLGVANSIRSLANIPGPFIAGFIFEIIGARESFFFTATLMLVSAILGIILFQKQKNMQSKQIQMIKNNEMNP